MLTFIIINLVESCVRNKLNCERLIVLVLNYLIKSKSVGSIDSKIVNKLCLLLPN